MPIVSRSTIVRAILKESFCATQAQPMATVGALGDQELMSEGKNLSFECCSSLKGLPSRGKQRKKDRHDVTEKLQRRLPKFNQFSENGVFGRDNYVGSGLCKCQCDHVANPSTRAGHQGDSTLEVIHDARIHDSDSDSDSTSQESPAQEYWRNRAGLASNGIYSKIRNPIYVFGTIFTVGMLLAFAKEKWLIVLLVLIPTQVIRARKEASVLDAKVGDEHREYRRKTWFLLILTFSRLSIKTAC